MYKIENLRLCGQNVAFNFGKVQFNTEGVAELPLEVDINSILKLEGYKLLKGQSDANTQADAPLENDVNNDDLMQSDQDPDEDDKQPEDAEPEDAEPEEAAPIFTEMTVKQLEKYAKTNNIVIDGITRKADLVQAIVMSIANQK